MDSLTEATNAVDLPALISELHPKSGAKPGTANLVQAVWRGDKNPSLSLFKARGGAWMWKDHSTGEGGNAFAFLTGVMNMKPQEAAQLLMSRVGIDPDGGRKPKRSSREAAKPQPKSEACERIPVPAAIIERMEFSEDIQKRIAAALEWRGFTEADAAVYGLLDKDGDGIIPITDPHGVIVAYKRRRNGATKQRYVYDTPGHGAPAWCSPGFAKHAKVMIVEGELNGVIAHSVLTQHGVHDVAVMGVAGAESKLHLDALADKQVLVYADGDEAGAKAKGAWSKAAVAAGAVKVGLMPPLPDGQDFCDVANSEGRKALFTELLEMFRVAQTTHSPMDREIGYYTVRELLDMGDRFLTGDILYPTGFAELDEYTRGMPDSGLIGIGALPSMGKSVLLRDILFNEVERGGKVMLFSPDQNVPSVLRLLASRRTGIPAWRAATNNFTKKMLDTHGGPEACRDLWREAFRETAATYSKRFVVNEDQYLPDIQKLMDVGIDQGVTLFGGDYLQAFDLDGDEHNSEGRAAMSFKEWVRSRKARVVFALQLAKSKFPPTRRSGVPYSTDIEGSGKIFQAFELMFMIYTYDIYSQEFSENGIVDPGTEYMKVRDGEYIPMTRIYVRKNKEGKRNDFRYLLWDEEVPAFRDTFRYDQVVSVPRRIIYKSTGLL
jgi:putative DNA primase/helicase